MVAVCPNHLVLLPRPEIPPTLSAYPGVPLYLVPNIARVPINDTSINYHALPLQHSTMP